MTKTRLNNKVTQRFLKRERLACEYQFAFNGAGRILYFYRLLAV
jgi:hypothetical protein